MSEDAASAFAPEIRALGARGDWPKLVRLWIATGGNELDALATALTLVDESDLPASLPNALRQLHSAPANYVFPEADHAALEEEASVTMALCALAAQISHAVPIQAHPLGERDALVQSAMDACERAIPLCDKIGDLAPAATLMEELATCLAAIGNPLLALDFTRKAVSIRRDQVERCVAFRFYLARSINNFAFLHGKLGFHAEALKLGKETLVLIESLTGEQREASFPLLAMALRNLADFARWNNDLRGAVSYAYRSLRLRRQLYRQTLGPLARFQADLAFAMETWAECLRDVEKPRLALKPAKRACKLLCKLTQSAPHDYASTYAGSLITFASCLGRGGKRRKAVKVAKRALRWFRLLAHAAPNAYIASYAEARDCLADMLIDVGRWQEGLWHSAKATRLLQRLVRRGRTELRFSLASSLGNQANAHYRCGQLQAALSRVDEAVTLFQELFSEQRSSHAPYLAKVLSNRAVYRKELGLKEDALEDMREALDLRRELVGNHSNAHLPELAISLNNLAVLLYELGYPQMAITPAKEAVHWRDALAKIDSETFEPYLATSLNNLGKYALALDDRDLASQCLEQAVALRQKLVDDHGEIYLPDLTMSLSNLSQLKERFDDIAGALALERESVQSRRLLTTSYPNTFERVLGESLVNYSRYLRKDGRPSEALDAADEAVTAYEKAALQNPNAGLLPFMTAYVNLADSLLDTANAQKALDALGKAKEIAERVRGSFRGTGYRRRTLNDVYDVYGRFMEVALDLWEIEGSPHHLKSAFETAEAGRARTLLDLVSNHAKPKNANPEDWQKRQALTNQLATLQCDEDGLSASGSFSIRDFVFSSKDDEPVPPSKENDTLPANPLTPVIESLEADLKTLDKNLEANDPGWGTRVAPPATLEDVCATLPNATALVQFSLLPTKGVALVVLPNGAVHKIDLPDLNEENAWATADAWNQAYFSHSRRESKRLAAMGDRLEAKQHFKRWFDEWEQVLPGLLSTIKRQVVQPLWSGLKETGLTKTLKRLIFSPHGPLHLYPLHTCLLDDKHVLGDAVEVAYTSSGSLLRHTRDAPRATDGKPLLVANPRHDLLFSEVESAGLKNRYHIESLHSSQATKETVLSQCEHASLFLYSGHSFFHEDDAFLSGLCLADGAANVNDFLRLRNLPRCRLAMLNGCESGLMEPDAADEYLNLPTALLYAGARCVISTLWPVHDLSATLASLKFHQLWRGGEGLSPAAALAATQRWLRGLDDDGLKTGVQLRDKVLPELLEPVIESETKDACFAVANEHAKNHPDSPPFANPVHWAAFTIHGTAW